jgi:hypothetical protein
MPFIGRWAANGTYPGSHDNYSADWGTDLYAVPGTDVRVNVGYSTSGYALSISQVTTNNCGAGKRVRVSVTFGGNEIGWVQYEHLDTSVSTSTPISNGAVLGKTKKWPYSAGCYEVNTDQGVHTHVGMKNSQGGFSCFVDKGAGVVAQENASIGVLGSTNSGQKQQCASVPSVNPTAPTVPTRIVVRNGNSLWANENNSGWGVESYSATPGKWQLSGDRLANMDANGLWVKDGNGAAYHVSNPVDEFQVSSTRSITRVGRNLYEVWPDSSYQLLSSTASAGNWKLSGNRLVNVDANGIWVNEGGIGWTRWGDSNFQEFQVSPNRIVVRNGTSLWANENNSGWNVQSYSASPGNWKLSGNRLAVMDANGLWVKDGNGATYRVSDPVDEFQISESRIATRAGGNLYEAWLNSSFQLLSYSASAGNWKLTGNRLVNVDANGIWVNNGGTFWTKWGNSDFQEFQS